MANLIERMIRAAKLDIELYEEVEADTTAMPQAVAVVVLSSIAAGIGTINVTGISSIVMVTISALIAWFVWALLIYIIGGKIMPEPQTSTDLGELLRTIGFSSSPGMIRILGIIPVPGLYNILSLIAGVWMLIAMVVAVRQALDYKSTGRAIGVCLIGWLIQILFIMLTLAIFSNSYSGGTN
ncbi:MAG: YIP1 family protein [Thermodesulfobacteriota bacterium]